VTFTCPHRRPTDHYGQELLDYKVSKERIGIEVNKMLIGRDPVRALSLLASSGIAKRILFPRLDWDASYATEFVRLADQYVLSHRIDHLQVLAAHRPGWRASEHSRG